MWHLSSLDILNAHHIEIRPIWLNYVNWHQIMLIWAFICLQWWNHIANQSSFIQTTQANIETNITLIPLYRWIASTQEFSSISSIWSYSFISLLVQIIEYKRIYCIVCSFQHSVAPTTSRKYPVKKWVWKKFQKWVDKWRILPNQHLIPYI